MSRKPGWGWAKSATGGRNVGLQPFNGVYAIKKPELSGRQEEKL